MSIETRIRSVKKIKIKKRHIKDPYDFVESLSKGGVKVRTSLTTVTIPIANIKNITQEDLQWIFARLYARCRSFSVEIKSD